MKPYTYDYKNGEYNEKSLIDFGEGKNGEKSLIDFFGKNDSPNNERSNNIITFNMNDDEEMLSEVKAALEASSDDRNMGESIRRSKKTVVLSDIDSSELENVLNASALSERAPKSRLFLYYLFVVAENKCPYCEKSIELLQKSEQKYVKDEITKPDKENFYKSIAKISNNYESFPVIFELYSTTLPDASPVISPIFIGGYEDLQKRLSDKLIFSPPPPAPTKKEGEPKTVCVFPAVYFEYLQSKYPDGKSGIFYAGDTNGIMGLGKQFAKFQELKNAKAMVFRIDNSKEDLGSIVIVNKLGIIERIQLDDEPGRVSNTMDKIAPYIVVLDFEGDSRLGGNSLQSKLLYVDLRLSNIEMEKEHMLNLVGESKMFKDKLTDKESTEKFLSEYFTGLCHMA
jgi:hypothetical protein